MMYFAEDVSRLKLSLYGSRLPRTFVALVSLSLMQFRAGETSMQASEISLSAFGLAIVFLGGERKEMVTRVCEETPGASGAAGLAKYWDWL